MIAQDAMIWGAEPGAEGRARFRLWAPGVEALHLRWDGRLHDMPSAGEGWFDLTLSGPAPGDAYAFVLPDGATVPDPASRAQVEDVHGPSRLVDPSAYRWRTDWQGRPWEEAVICELHVGTFSPEGTFDAVADRLPHLARAGFTAIELMPVAHFAGRRGWGYDGVLPWAPHPAYGTPDDLRALVDAAHAEGLMVLLDVVYNHFGPEGNYLHLYADAFFDESRQTPWGAAIDFTRLPVRRFFADNALHWLKEYRLDGLRFDAIDQISDPSEPDILMEIARRVRAEIPDRPVHLTTEDNRNVTYLHERGEGGSVPLFTAEWNDDMHNAAHVLATGETAGYYADFADDPLGQLARSLAEGFAWQGEIAPSKGAPRGRPSAHLPPAAFVDFLQNHDQIGNRAFGERLCALTDPDLERALRAVHLLSPHIPLLFMGEEYGETRPFLFFTDFHGDLADAVREGRRREFADFPAFAGHAEDLARIPDPNAFETFDRSRLDCGRLETEAGRSALEETRRLLALRAEHVTPRLAEAGAGRVIAAQDGALAVDWPLGPAAWRLRANLAETPQALPPAPGRVVHATHEAEGERAPARSVSWVLDEEPAG